MSNPPKTASDRSFGLVFTCFFAFLGLLPLLHGGAVRVIFLVVAAAFLLIALARPGLLAPLNQLWTRFGLLLNRITTPIVMSILFWVIFTPVGLLMRLFGKRPLQLHTDQKAASYWLPRQNPAPDSMQRPF
ncbi:MAG: hypothetical protein HQL87_16455 [Magnetococcales bacterium]|nr:hypothetical protein [Magnetococcales bacterium]